jgi:6,7-dimethyl-8-ribityllumazine synthase
MTLTAPPPTRPQGRRVEVVEVPVAPVDAADLPDGAIVSALHEISAARRRLDAIAVAWTSEVTRRSDRARGQDNLAARLGVPTVEAAVQTLTGTTRAEAKALTAVANVASGASPWLDSVSSSVAQGELSVSAAAAIAIGLGTPTTDVTTEDLHEAAETLVAAARTDRYETPENLARRARQAREDLERDRIADLEEHRRSRRSLTWVRTHDGMTRMNALLDPESAAIITGALDTALSPRKGGPRFVDPDEQARAARQEADPRTTEQLSVDTLVEIVQLATRAATSELDPEKVFGSNSPAVRVHVPLEALLTGIGTGWIEGQDAPISAHTAARHVCTSGLVPVLFDGRVSIDTGKTHRLHSTRQRIAIAAQWGGCAWHGCSRPPAMTEMHHMEAFDGENTTLCNAIPLCRFHHMQLHNRGWRIRVDRGPTGEAPPRHWRYWLHPPSDYLAGTAPIELHPRG